MQVSYDAVVTQPIDAVWASLTDVDSVLAALPWAALAHEGPSVSGSLKCKVGSTQITYRLTARAEVGDRGFHTARITVVGQEARGDGTLAAVLTVSLRSAADDTEIEISGDVTATGRGEAAEASAWQRVLKVLLNTALPPLAAPPPSPPPAAKPQRPSLSVAPPPHPAVATASPMPTWLGVAGVALVVIYVARRRRSRGKPSGA